MSSDFTPAGGVAELTAPESTPFEGSPRLRYVVDPVGQSFSLPIPARPPTDILLDVVARQEDGIVAMTAVDLDISVEGEHPAAALLLLLDAVEEWLKYVRDEAPELSPALAPHRPFAELLNYDRLTWFKSLSVE
jgi:hypothetical protein